MATKLFLIRHGITKWNKQKRYCGNRDIDLSSEGRLQALKLRKKLKGVNFDKIYCSNKKRAIHTAGIIFKGARIIKAKDLREISFGIFEGLSYQAIMQKCPGIYQRWLTDPFSVRIPKAEPMSAFKNRVNRALRRIAAKNTAKAVAVVCHGGVIGIFVSSVLKSRNFWRYVPDAASITVAEYKEGKAGIKLFNQTAHLR